MKLTAKPTIPGHDAKSLSSRLRRLLSEQLAAAQQFDALARQQSEAVIAGQDELLAPLLSERAALLHAMRHTAEQVTALSQALTGRPAATPGAPPAAADRNQVLGALIAEHRQPVAELLTALDALFAQIQQRDAADVRTLTAHRDEVAREMAAVATNKGAALAYGDQPAHSAMFQDRQG